MLFSACCHRFADLQRHCHGFCKDFKAQVSHLVHGMWSRAFAFGCLLPPLLWISHRWHKSLPEDEAELRSFLRTVEETLSLLQSRLSRTIKMCD